MSNDEKKSQESLNKRKIVRAKGLKEETNDHYIFVDKYHLLSPQLFSYHGYK